MKQIRILTQCNLIHLIPAGVLFRFVLVRLYINIKNFIKKWEEKKLLKMRKEERGLVVLRKNIFQKNTAVDQEG